MKKVLIFSLAYFPQTVGGAEVAIKELTDRITDIEFYMITNRFDSALSKYEKIGNVHVHRIGITRYGPTMADLKRLPLNINKPLYQFLAVWYAYRLHRKYKFDAIYAVMAHSCGVPAAIFKFFYPMVPYILNLQEGDPIGYIEKKMRPLWPLFKMSFTSANVVHAISTFLGQWARTRGFVGRLEIIPNGVDVVATTYHYSQDVIADTRASIGARDGDVVLFTASRLVAKNAIDDVLRALQILQSGVIFVVAGSGHDEYALKLLANELGVADMVRFIGQISQQDVRKYLQASDIFIRASRSEGMGNSFIEAMASGIPVIATQEGGIADFLFDESRNPNTATTGWAVDKDSPQQIADSVRAILADKENTLRVVANAKKMACEKYDWNIIAYDFKNKVLMPVMKC